MSAKNVKWEWKKLKDICEKGSSSVKQGDLKGVNGDYPIYGASGFIQNVDFFQQSQEYIGIVKDGSGVGRTMLLPAKSSVIGTLQYILPKEGNSLKFINYALQNFDFSKLIQGAAIPHIYFKDYGEMDLAVPPIDEQKRIVKVLDETFEKIDAIKTTAETNLQNAKDLFKNFLKQTFENNEYQKIRLGDCGDLKNGLNFSPSESGCTLRYLGVGDFKDHFSIKDVSTLSEISLNSSPNKEYLLEDGDIIFVRSNGNKALVGRSLLIYPGNVKTTYSGFCIRFRNSNSNLNSIFLLHFLKSPAARKVLQGKDGANIQNLNQKILGELQIPLPPLPIQKQIVAKLDSLSEKVKQLESNYKQILADCEELKKAVLKKAFNGNL